MIRKLKYIISVVNQYLSNIIKLWLTLDNYTTFYIMLKGLENLEKD